MKTAIQTDNAPKAIGTYSQAMKAGNLVFLSGQIPLTASGELLKSPDIRGDITQVFLNLQAVAKAAGGNLSDIVKLTVYLTQLGDFGHVNEVMKTFFNEPYPARAVVEVSALPKGAQIEIDAIMLLA